LLKSIEILEINALYTSTICGDFKFFEVISEIWTFLLLARNFKNNQN